MSGFLSSLFGSAENHDSNKLVRSKRLRGRSLRMESLEERALLSVAPADLAAVQDLFPDYEFADNTNYIEVTNGADYTAGSLRDAIYQAGRTTEDDVIIVRTPSVDLLDTLQINIDAEQFGSVTIVGLTISDSGLTNLSGKSQFQVINVGAGTQLNLGHLNVIMGKSAADQNGGGIGAVDAVLNISDVRFRGNATAGVSYAEYGGGVFQQGGHSTLNNVTFQSNTSVFGSGFAVLGGTTEQTNVIYQGNTADSTYGECWGGGIYAQNATVELVNPLIQSNRAMLGSGVYFSYSDVSITNGTIARNNGSYAVGASKEASDPNTPISSLTLRNSIVLGNYNSNSPYQSNDVYLSLTSIDFAKNIIGTYYQWCGPEIDAVENNLGLYTTYDVFDGNYLSLRAESPGVNAGDNSFVTAAYDIQGNARIQKGTVDLGAYESAFGEEVPVTPLPDLVPFAPEGWESPLVVSRDPNALQDADTIAPGEFLYASWALKNTGTIKTDSAFKVELLLDGTVVWENTFPSGLPANYILPRRAIQLGSLGIGEHTLELRLDTLGAVTEADETNNVFTKTFRVEGPQADLTPFAPQGWTAPIVFTDSSVGIVDAEAIQPYESFYISWGLKNIGEISAQNGFQVTLLLDGQEYWSNTYPSWLPADYFLQYRGIEVSGLAAGEYEFELRVDALNEINESDETNNVFTRTLTIVESPLPDLAFTTPEGWDSSVQVWQDYNGADPERLMAGYPVFINAAVVNQGNAYAETFVGIRVDGNPVGSFKIYGLEPGGTMISPNIPLHLGPGEHRIELVIDPYNYVAESDETNNLYSTTVFIDTLRPDFVFENYNTGSPAVELWQAWQYDNGGGNDFIADEPIDIRYYVANLAGNTQDNVAVGIYVDGVLYDTQEFGLYSAHHYHSSSYMLLSGLGVGEHVIEIRIDPDNLIAEENEANNVYRTTINVVAPDLVAAGLVISSTPGATEDDALFVSGTPIFVNWSVLNEGVDSQRNFNVELFLNGTRIFGQAFYDELPNGAELSRVFDNLYSGLPAGEYVFELRVNPNGQLAESDYSNNVLMKTITVVERIPQVASLNSWTNIITNNEVEIVLDWYAEEFDGLRFEVERSVAGSGQWEKVGDGGQFGPYWSFRDFDVEPGMTYEYRVVGYAPDGQTSVSAEIEIVEIPALPSIAAPTGLSASVQSSTQANVAWDAVDGATSYRLERSVSGSSNWTTVYQGSATSFSNTGLAANTTYVYRVASVDGSTVSDYSVTVSAQTQKSGTAAVPTDLKTTSVTKNSIAVSWGGNTSNVSGYVVQWSEDGTTWKSATVKKNVKSYTITGLTAGTNYLVRVAAQSKAGQSGWSDLLSVQTVALPAKPLPPTGLTLVSKKSSSATISWTPSSSEVTGYRIEYSMNGNSWSSVTVSSNANTATITGLKSNKAYTIRIVALNGEVLSEYSALLTI